MPIAWVTGARGFIGRHLALYLGGRGFVVCGVGHGHLPPEHLAQAGLASWSNSEITPESLDQLAIGNGAPDFVFHLAGGAAVGASLNAPFEDFTRTTHTTARLLEWLRVHSPRTRLVVASSAAVYGDTAGMPARESLRPAPVSPYGYHKLMMEQLCQEYSHIFGLSTAVLRLFSVYGEGLRKQLLWDCGVKLMSGADVIEFGGSGEELRDWVHVDDAVRMMHQAAALASAESPLFNGGSGIGVRVRDIVNQLAICLRRMPQIRFSGISRRGDPTVLVADTERIVSAGISCRIPMDLGVQRYADWFQTARNE